jgi:SAM-dependent methyltransferase
MALEETDGAPELWNARAGAAWIRQQQRTDRQLESFGHALMAKLEPRPGERVLDVGCGCGQTTIELGQRVAPGGAVVGVDISDEMLAYARSRAVREGAQNVEFVHADAERAPFEDGKYDVVFSRFGVMFFENAQNAFENLRRALTSKGRLGFVCWQAFERNPWSRLPLRAVQDALQIRELPPLFIEGSRGPFAFADPDLVRGILEGAGFRGIAIDRFETQMRVGASTALDDIVEYASEIGPAARLIAAQDPELRPRGVAALRECFASLLTAEGVVLDAAAFLVTALA